MGAMYEISTDERFASSLLYIKRRLASKSIDCDITVQANKSSLVTQGGNESLLVDAIADVIITDCKAYYITEKIKLPVRDKISRHAFISALLAFDHDTDKIIAKTLIRLTPTFHLDSFYEFMLDILKMRWNEVVHLANENICYLVCQKTFNELLQFLISNIDCSMDETMFMHIKDAPIREDVKKLFCTCTVVN